MGERIFIYPSSLLDETLVHPILNVGCHCCHHEAAYDEKFSY